MYLFLMLLTTVLFGVGRLFSPGSDLTWESAYEAAAHIWVGIVIAACWTALKPFKYAMKVYEEVLVIPSPFLIRQRIEAEEESAAFQRRMSIWLLVAVSGLELYMATHR